MGVADLTGMGILGALTGDLLAAWLLDFVEPVVWGLVKLAGPSEGCVRGCEDRLALLAISSCHRMAAANERSAWLICSTQAALSVTSGSTPYLHT